MLRTFLFEIAGCTSNFTVQNRQQTCIAEIREKVDKSKVLVSETEAGLMRAGVGTELFSEQRDDRKTKILSTL